MNKTYRKDGNSKNKGKAYCKGHFIEHYGREPNILDTAHLSSCSDHHHCEHISGLGYLCNGFLKLTAKHREDNQCVEEWTCQVCGNITSLRQKHEIERPDKRT